MVNSFDNGRQVGIDAYNGPNYNNDPVYKNQGYIDACESQGLLCSTAGSAWNGLPQGSFSGQTGGAPNPNKGIFETNFYLEKGKKRCSQ